MELAGSVGDALANATLDDASAAASEASARAAQLAEKAREACTRANQEASVAAAAAQAAAEEAESAADTGMAAAAHGGASRRKASEAAAAAAAASVAAAAAIRADKAEGEAGTAASEATTAAASALRLARWLSSMRAVCSAKGTMAEVCTVAEARLAALAEAEVCDPTNDPTDLPTYVAVILWSDREEAAATAAATSDLAAAKRCVRAPLPSAAGGEIGVLLVEAASMNCDNHGGEEDSSPTTQAMLQLYASYVAGCLEMAWRHELRSCFLETLSTWVAVLADKGAGGAKDGAASKVHVADVGAEDVSDRDEPPGVLVVPLGPSRGAITIRLAGFAPMGERLCADLRETCKLLPKLLGELDALPMDDFRLHSDDTHSDDKPMVARRSGDAMATARLMLPRALESNLVSTLEAIDLKSTLAEI